MLHSKNVAPLLFIILRRLGGVKNGGPDPLDTTPLGPAPDAINVDVLGLPPQAFPSLVFWH